MQHDAVKSDLHGRCTPDVIRASQDGLWAHVVERANLQQHRVIWHTVSGIQDQPCHQGGAPGLQHLGVLALMAPCRAYRLRRAASMRLTWLSRAMLVVSLLMALAMPKSISLSCPSTIRKLAGFRSECTMRAS